MMCAKVLAALLVLWLLTFSQAPVVSVSKGLTIQTLELMCDVIPAALMRDQPMAFLSGPSFAREVRTILICTWYAVAHNSRAKKLMEKHPTTVVVASKDVQVARRVQELFLSLDFRVYLSDDYIGVEVGGALKNVIAVASGIVQGQFTRSHTISPRLLLFPMQVLVMAQTLWLQL